MENALSSIFTGPSVSMGIKKEPLDNVPVADTVPKKVLERIMKQVVDLEKQMKAKMENKDAELSAEKKMNFELKQKTEKLGKIVTSLDGELSAERKITEELFKKTENIKIKVEVEESEVESLKLKIRVNDAKMNEVLEENRVLKVKLNDAESAQNTQNVDQNYLKESLEKMRVENSVKQSRIQSMEKSIKEKDVLTNELKRKISMMITEFSKGVEEKNEEFKLKEAKLKESLNQKDVIIEDLIQKNKESAKEYLMNVKEKNKLTLQLATQLKTITSEKLEMSSQLEETLTDKNKLATQLEKKETEKSKLSSRIGKLNSELDKFKFEKNKLETQQENMLAKQKEDDIQTEFINQLQNKIAELERQKIYTCITCKDTEKQDQTSLNLSLKRKITRGSNLKKNMLVDNVTNIKPLATEAILDPEYTDFEILEASNFLYENTVGDNTSESDTNNGDYTNESDTNNSDNANESDTNNSWDSQNDSKNDTNNDETDMDAYYNEFQVPEQYLPLKSFNILGLCSLKQIMDLANNENLKINNFNPMTENSTLDTAIKVSEKHDFEADIGETDFDNNSDETEGPVSLLSNKIAEKIDELFPNNNTLELDQTMYESSSAISNEDQSFNKKKEKLLMITYLWPLLQYKSVPINFDEMKRNKHTEESKSDKSHFDLRFPINEENCDSGDDSNVNDFNREKNDLDESGLNVDRIDNFSNSGPPTTLNAAVEGEQDDSDNDSIESDIEYVNDFDENDMDDYNLNSTHNENEINSSDSLEIDNITDKNNYENYEPNKSGTKYDSFKLKKDIELNVCDSYKLDDQMYNLKQLDIPMKNIKIKNFDKIMRNNVQSAKVNEIVKTEENLIFDAATKNDLVKRVSDEIKENESLNNTNTETKSIDNDSDTEESGSDDSSSNEYEEVPVFVLSDKIKEENPNIEIFQNPTVDSANSSLENENFVNSNKETNNSDNDSDTEESGSDNSNDRSSDDEGPDFVLSDKIKAENPNIKIFQNATVDLANSSLESPDLLADKANEGDNEDNFNMDIEENEMTIILDDEGNYENINNDGSTFNETMSMEQRPTIIMETKTLIKDLEKNSPQYFPHLIDHDYCLPNNAERLETDTDEADESSSKLALSELIAEAKAEQMSRCKSVKDQDVILKTVDSIYIREDEVQKAIESIMPETEKLLQETESLKKDDDIEDVNEEDDLIQELSEDEKGPFITRTILGKDGKPYQILTNLGQSKDMEPKLTSGKKRKSSEFDIPNEKKSRQSTVPEEVTCDICGKYSGKTKNALASHKVRCRREQKSKLNERSHCDICGEYFKNASGLAVHKGTRHKRVGFLH